MNPNAKHIVMSRGTEADIGPVGAKEERYWGTQEKDPGPHFAEDGVEFVCFLHTAEEFPVAVHCVNNHGYDADLLFALGRESCCIGDVVEGSLLLVKGTECVVRHTWGSRSRGVVAAHCLRLFERDTNSLRKED